MNLKEQLKELSFQMMLVETRKMQIENSHSFSIKTGNTASPYSTEEGYHQGILAEDKKGYELSLAFNELLLQNGMRYNDYVDGPDAVNIAAENLLYKYGIAYPISWYVDYETSERLHFGYHDSATIDINHEKYLTDIKQLFLERKINKQTFERLVHAGEYYKQHHKLLSKYNNKENLNEQKPSIKH